jgi:hypothetical protein
MVLIGYWPLNGESGDMAYDHSRNENHGTINDGGDSTVPGATGILGQNAYSFDGANDYVDIPNFSKFSSYTITYWTYPLSAGGSNQEHLDVRANNHLEIQHSNGTVTLYHEGPNNYPQISTDIVNSKWQFFAWTWNGKDVIGYKNGSKIGKGTATGMEDNNKSIDNIASDQGGGEFFEGKISEVRVYNHALTPAEVQYLYNVSKRGRQVSSSKQS